MKYFFILCVVLFSLKVEAQVASVWTMRVAAANNRWNAITYGNGLFVAVAISGTDKIMTSNDGVTWILRTAPVDDFWRGVTFGNGIFVCVGESGVITSTDGIVWTSRTSIVKRWESVTFGNGLFVAVTASGVGNRVMTSANGINWTSQATPVDNSWMNVTFGNGLFVAVAGSGINNRVMTSSDGITWVIRTSAADNIWNSIVYGNGLFVSVAVSGTNNRVMTSVDGITWTSRTTTINNSWTSITYGNGTFVAVSSDGVGNRVMTSTDGITWTARASASDNGWIAVTFSNGLFVAVATFSSGTTDKVMTSGTLISLPVNFTSFTAKANGNTSQLNWATATEVNNKGFNVQHSTDGITYNNLGFVNGNGNSTQNNSYAFTHVSPGNGNNYYRLQQIDNDGKIAYSPVQVVNFSQLTTALSVYPNPVISTINFNKNFAAGTTLQIVNTIGQVVENSVFGGNRYQPKTQLKGMFKVVIVESNNSRTITNIIVQ